MQVNLSFTLNLKKEMKEEDLIKILEEGCPMEVTDKRFVLSTERWDIIN